MSAGDRRPASRGKGRTWTRRELLGLSPLLLVAGCDMMPEGRTESFLRSFQKFNDWFQSKIFDGARLSREYPPGDVTPEEGFRVNDMDDDPPALDAATWTLTLEGLVARPGPYTLAQIASLPKRVMNTRHVCVEGWSMIPRWGGTPVAEFLTMAGADPAAKYLSVACADEYTTSYDMPSALHPQTLLCYEAYDRPLTAEHGAPVRIVMPTKLGYKSAKWVTKLVVTNEKPGGYWEDQGYDWFAGI